MLLFNSEFGKSLKHFRNYLGGGAAEKAAGIISMPIFTRILTKEDYGLVAIFLSYTGILSVVMVLNSHSAVSRYYFEEKNDFDEFLGSTVLFSLLVFSTSTAVFLLFRDFWMHQIGLPETLIYAICVAIFSHVVFSFFTQLNKAQQKSGQYTIVSVAKTYTGIVVSILLVVNLSQDKYLGRIWGNVANAFVFSLILIPYLRKHIRFRFKAQHIKYTLLYAAPLIPATLSGVILAQFDRIMIFNYSGASDTGLYSVAYSIGMLMVIVIHASRGAVAPKWFKMMNRKDYGNADLLSVQHFCLALLAALGLVYFSKELLFILSDRKFHEAAPVIPVVVVGYAFFALDQIYRRYLGYSKETIYVSIIMIASGAANLVLNAVFIPKYGYIAGAFTTAASYLLMSLMSWLVVKYRLSLLHLPINRVFKPLFLFLVFVAFYYGLATTELNIFIMFFIKLVLVATFALLIYRTSFYNVIADPSKELNL